jgi:hypothetical protein
VQAIEAIPHGAATHHPEAPAPDRLAAQVTDMIVRYLSAAPLAETVEPTPPSPPSPPLPAQVAASATIAPVLRISE